jgi:hypothetical protein
MVSKKVELDPSGILNDGTSHLPFMMRAFILLLSALCFVSCSSLPVPGSFAKTESTKEAAAILRRSAAAHGDPWKKSERVRVSYDGEWSALATRLQPVLTDPAFRKRSDEIYQPRLRTVRQTHTGPSGTKVVLRGAKDTRVTFNGTASGDPEVLGAAALVADAYTIFLFGSSWLAENARDLRSLESADLAGEDCDVLAGRLSPGIGSPSEDHFIVWIGKESRLMRRFQFSLNALDSTRGADVDVVFHDHWKAADGSVWPSRFVETIQRPILTKAHEWRMTGLAVDGKILKVAAAGEN